MAEIAWTLYAFGVLTVASAVGTMVNSPAVALLIVGFGALLASLVVAVRMMTRWVMGS